LSPDLIDSIKQGHCVRTLYVTAGDAGSKNYYWLGRQQGSEAAYSKMIGKDVPWIERIVKVSDNAYVTIANPKGNRNVSLIFVHLPDGGPSGNGFTATNHETLAKLEAGNVNLIHAVDRQSSYGLDDLTKLLANLMQIYQPAEIRTQGNYSTPQGKDHGDHIAVGQLVNRAYSQYEQQQFDNDITIPLKFYIGYPVGQLPENVSGDELSLKQAAFFDYAKYDGATCNSLEVCSNAAYGLYLPRQYQIPE
jgi:hypothetical protein